MAVRVNAETFAAEVLQAKGLVLVDFLGKAIKKVL